ncbi:MAG TPA: YcaO-like family protein [Bryobacteraceae bacterium]|nr:YcaO-like family protein [Bryobacteraceae bacterium]
MKGSEIWVGPEVIPGKTACWRCLQWWLLLREIDTSCDTGNPDTYQLVADLLDGAQSLQGRMCSMADRNSRPVWHEILRRPDCPDCGAGMQAGLVGSLERIRRSVSAITGFVTDIETSESHGSALSFGHIVTPHAPNVPKQRAAGRMTIAGQGVDPDSAELACLAEAAERYSAVFQGHEPRVCATYDEISEFAIYPAELLQFSEQQYENRYAWNHGEWGFPYVPPRYDPRQQLEWTAVSSITKRTENYLPTQYCYSASAPADTPLYCVPDSNGCAAGQTLQDAVARGFLELVERDAIAIWWYNRIRRPAVHTDYLDDPEIVSVWGEIKKRRNVEMLDLTTDLGIFVFGAVACDAAGSDITLGFGAHFDPKLAARRAARELAQVSAECDELPSGTPQRGSLEYAFARWREQARISSEPHLVPIRISSNERRVNYLDPGVSVFKQCVHTCKQHALDLLALNLTRPEIGLPVARVVCPELRSPWRRLAPGRLYNLPVKLGWIPSPRAEHEMNPSPYCL